MSKLKWGILGGTFNPIHNAHLFVANEIRKTLEFEKIMFLPTGTPPHKNNLNINAFHRLKMTKLAAENNSFFKVSDFEIQNQDISYTVDTIEKLKELHPDIDFYFIIGADEVMLLDTWKNAETLLKICKFVAVRRPNFDDEELSAKINYLTENFNGELLVVDIPKLDISSTLIRNRVKEGKTVRYLLPDSVNDYILKNKLYID